MDAVLGEIADRKMRDTLGLRLQNRLGPYMALVKADQIRSRIYIRLKRQINSTVQEHTLEGTEKWMTPTSLQSSTMKTKL